MDKHNLVRIFPGILIAFIFFFFAVATIEDYGVDWDSPENFDVGEIYLRFFETGNVDYLKFTNENPYYAEALRPLLSINTPYSFPPVANTFAALTKQIFFDDFHLLGKYSAYHISIIILSTIFIFLLYYFVLKNYGLVAAVFSSISLAIFPRFFSMAHNSVKDIPMTIFFSISLMTFYQAYKTQKKSWVIVSAIIFGLALNTKINALFIPLVLSIWLAFLCLVWLMSSKKRIFNIKKNISKLRKKLYWALFPIISSLTIYITWPLLWGNPVSNFILMLDFYRNIVKNQTMEVIYFGKIYIAGQDLPWHYTPVFFLISTPIYFLIIGFLGLFIMARDFIKRNDKLALLILIWFFFPFVKLILTGFVYGGIRQYLEIIPAFCIMIGVGAKFLHINLVKKISNKFLKIKKKQIQSKLVLFRNKSFVQALALFILGVIFIATVILIDIEIHPYQNSYFNEFVGGSKGVYDSTWTLLYSTDYYRSGAEWINENAPLNSTVRAEFSGFIGDTFKVYLREDIQVISDDLRPDYYIMPYEIDLNITPLYVGKAMGAPVVVVYNYSDLEKSYLFNSTSNLGEGRVHLYRYLKK